ncbi:MAG: spermidine/putrescine transport system ATP-binding protein [Actinomycetota bacterium]|nr:spermidine/putrescine transport system ATP-binding protein [Actinomycetota bacterium]
MSRASKGTAQGQVDGGRDLRIGNVTKRFGSFVAVDDLSLTVPSGSFFALLGPSGCGKTTTLRMVAGLEEPSEGSILIGDQDVTFAKPYRRPVNTVFQSYALFPHLDIFENVAFGLRRRGSKEVKKQVDDALELVELGGFAKRKPAQLSGGQQQRVALARAIVNKPAVLLLDEPLGALDLKLRRQMQIELKRIQTEVGLTFVHVTHDQEEAMTMADTIAVMNNGRIEQLGNPEELYESPTTTFVANFLGQSNLIRSSVTGTSGTDVQLEVHGGRLAMPQSRRNGATDDLLIGVRPEKIRISPTGQDANAEQNELLGGVVTDASFTGVSTQYLVRMPWGQELMVFAQNVGVGGVLAPGTQVDLRWDPAHTFALDGSLDAGAGVQRDEGATPVPVG